MFRSQGPSLPVVKIKALYKYLSRDLYIVQCWISCRISFPICFKERWQNPQGIEPYLRDLRVVPATFRLGRCGLCGRPSCPERLRLRIKTGSRVALVSRFKFHVSSPFGKVLAKTSQGVGKVLARIKGLLELARCLADTLVQGSKFNAKSSKLMAEGLGAGDEFLMDGGQHFGSFAPLGFFAEVGVAKVFVERHA